MVIFRKALLLILSVVLTPPLLPAQGLGIVDGRLVNGTNGSAVASGITVEVLGLMGGMSVVKSAVTDAGGKFHIDGLPVDTPLLIRATYREIQYHSMVRFDNKGKASVEIQVFEPTASNQGIRLESAQIAFKRMGDGLSSIESYTFANETKPPRSYMNEDGNFRFSKAPGITEPPGLGVTAPGSTMPVSQPPLESADGLSYYSLYPLRPGSTTFEVSQALPYQNGSYTYRKKFYQDVTVLNIGVIPLDVNVSGGGLKKVQADAERNFAVYSTGPIKAGTEVVWTFSGGTPIAETPAANPGEPSASPEAMSVRPMPTIIGQNAAVISVLLLAALMVILIYANSRILSATETDREAARMRELKGRREQLLNYVAALDAQNENIKGGPARNEYLRVREQSKRHLRRIATLLRGN